MGGAGFPSGSDEAFAEHDGELGFCLGPLARRHFPFLNDLAQDQEDEFGRRLAVGEMASRPTARRSLAFKASMAFVTGMVRDSTDYLGSVGLATTGSLPLQRLRRLD